MGWLDEEIVKEAGELAENGSSHAAFGRVIARRLKEQPVSAWEAAHWSRGLKLGLIKLTRHRFRLGSGRRSSFSFFVRSDRGLMAALRRESVTQAAAYVALVTDYGWPRAQVRFETDRLDVAVRDERDRLLLCAETKAADRTLELLVDKLSGDFEQGLPPAPEGNLPPDPWRKARHILRSRPEHFWGVAPGVRRAFRVEYAAGGFVLKQVNDAPSAGRSRLRRPSERCPGLPSLS